MTSSAPVKVARDASTETDLTARELDRDKRDLLSRALLGYMYEDYRNNVEVQVMVRLFIDAGAEVDAPAGGGWATPLRLAARRGQTDIVRLLLSNPNMEVNRRDEDGLPPLYWAVVGCYADVVDVLLVARAEVNMVLHAGTTAIHEAVNRNACAVAEVLIQYSADVNLPFPHGDTPLQRATNTRNSKLVDILSNAESIS